MRFPDFPTIMPARRSLGAARFWLSKKWLAPLFRGFHSSLAPTARPGSYAGKPLLRKAFCGFDAHVAKSDYSLWGLRPPNPRGFFDRLRRAAHWERRACFVYGGRKGNKQGRCRLMVPAAPHRGLCAYWLCALSQRPAWPGGGGGGRALRALREGGRGLQPLPPSRCLWAGGPGAPGPQTPPPPALPPPSAGAAAFRGRGQRPRPRNKPAAGRCPAAGGWAAPTRRRAEP